jgi:hypothetical protein
MSTRSTDARERRESRLLQQTQGHEHGCRPPQINSMTGPVMPPWTCGICERIWQFQWYPAGFGGWCEVRGPRHD